jgi:hypothetical protein
MAIQHLPRPWLLAALADVPVTMLAQHDPKEPTAAPREHRLPRPEPRRRRLSVRRLSGQRPDEWHGEDHWRGVEQWQDLEAERAN